MKGLWTDELARRTEREPRLKRPEVSGRGRDCFLQGYKQTNRQSYSNQNSISINSTDCLDQVRRLWAVLTRILTPNKRKMELTDGEWWRDAVSFVCFHPIFSPLPPTLMIQLAEVLRLKKKKSCEHKLPWRWGDEQWHACMCVWKSTYSFFPSSSSLLFFRPRLFLSPPSPRLSSASHGRGFFLGCSTRRSLSVWMKSEDRRGVRRVHLGVLLGSLRSRGQGLTCHLSMRHKRSCQVT